MLHIVRKRCNWLSRKICVRNDLLCAESDVKLCLFSLQTSHQQLAMPELWCDWKSLKTAKWSLQYTSVTDRKTEMHCIHRICIASRGKKIGFDKFRIGVLVTCGHLCFSEIMSILNSKRRPHITVNINWQFKRWDINPVVCHNTLTAD